MDKKYGVYICTGCGIGDALDIDGLCATVKKARKTAKTHPFLCGQDGVGMLKKDISDEGVNTLVIAACSRRVNFDIFRFDGCIVDRVNLREQVVWSHPKGDKSLEINHTQMLAADYLKMGMVRVEKVQLPEPYKLENFSRKILVIGGGITGISAALDAAKVGYDVTIVEKEAKLGGYAAKIRKQLPVNQPYTSLIPPMIADKIREVESFSNITVKTNTIVARIAGQPGEFTVTLKKPGEALEFDVPFPLPPEMKVDESGKELDKDKLNELYKEFNTGKNDILSLDPNGEKFGAVVLAAGWRPYLPAEG